MRRVAPGVRPETPLPIVLKAIPSDRPSFVSLPEAPST
jgi:hypothetical protein